MTHPSDLSPKDRDLYFVNAWRYNRRRPWRCPCPSCGEPNALTPYDHAQGLVCLDCVEKEEPSHAST